MPVEYEFRTKGCTKPAYRGRNHDAGFVEEREGVLVAAVADGIGPTEDAAQAATDAIYLLREFNPWGRGPYAAACEVGRVGVRRGDTTLTVVAIDRDLRLTYGYAGDSPVALVREGRMYELLWPQVVGENKLLNHIASVGPSDEDVWSLDRLADKLVGDGVPVGRAPCGAYVPLVKDDVVVVATDGAYAIFEENASKAVRFLEERGLAFVADELVDVGADGDDATVALIRIA